jgi:hypothetical protein
MSLRDQVENLLPEWRSWYPSLFHAAEDLGLIRARVCDLSSLVLSRRHANIQNEAVQAFREQWSVEEPEEVEDDVRRTQSTNGDNIEAPRLDEDTLIPLSPSRERG